jgi:hypothetical protein
MSNRAYLGTVITALIGGLAISTVAHAQAPSGTANVWTPPALSMNDCVQRGSTALRTAGATKTDQKTVFPGMAFVTAILGDYSAMIMCITFKGVVVFTVHGPDGATAENYRVQLNDNMGNSR